MNTARLKHVLSMLAHGTSKTAKRIAREKRTVQAMIGLYCRGHHAGEAVPCGECSELLQYALARLDRCPLAARKPTCARCPIHCYKPQMRERIKSVMRYAGPRMLWWHPILALLHQWDALCSRLSAGHICAYGRQSEPE